VGSGKAGRSDAGGEAAVGLVQASYELIEGGAASLADDDGQPDPGVRLGDEVEANPLALDHRRRLGEERQGQAVDRACCCRPGGPGPVEAAKAQLVGDLHRALEGAHQAHQGDRALSRADQPVAASHPPAVEAQSGAG